MAARGLLIFDGDCGFCRTWIERWRVLTGPSIEYRPYQEVGAQYPEIATESFEQAVHFIVPGRKVSRGAEAVFRTLDEVPGHRAWIRLYERSALFRALSEWGYAQVARRRVLFSWATYLLIGEDVRPSTYRLILRGFFWMQLVLASFLVAGLVAGMLAGRVGHTRALPLPELGAFAALAVLAGYWKNRVRGQCLVVWCLRVALAALFLLRASRPGELSGLVSGVQGVAAVAALGPRRLRLGAFCVLVPLQFWVLATRGAEPLGLLALTLCWLLLDDQILSERASSPT